MSETVIPVPQSFADARINAERYKEMYERSIKDPDGFWADEAKRLDWFTAPTKISDVSFSKDDLHIRWFEDGVLKVS